MTKIIAEIGVNWLGDLEHAKFMIMESKRAGADYVKFQLFDESNLGNADKNYDKLKTMILDLNRLSILRDAARKLGIGFIVTPMYIKAFHTLESVDVDILKIRYASRTDDELAKLAVGYSNKCGIPILVSTQYDGHCYDVSRVYARCTVRECNCLFMYCVPLYPPSLEDIKTAYFHSGVYDGYSNHYPSKYLPMYAVALGLKYVEVHVMLKDSWPVDRSVSLDFDDLREICVFRDVVKNLGYLL